MFFQKKIADGKNLGARGEQEARRFLEKKGLQFVAQNYHAQGGEVDLIFRKPHSDDYILVEVKTRTNDAFGSGASAITKAKFRKILSAGTAFFLKTRKNHDVPNFEVHAVIVSFDGSSFFCDYIEGIGFDDFQ